MKFHKFVSKLALRVVQTHLFIHDVQVCEFDLKYLLGS